MHLSSVDDVPDIDRKESSSNPKEKKETLKMFWKFIREFICILALVLTTLASINNKSIRQNRTMSLPIFPNYIEEWPSGSLTSVIDKIESKELSLVYFYAPWCAESHYAKHVFARVAQHYQPDAYFAAVNCWNPGSECKSYYSKDPKWPVVIAYMPNGFAVPYNGDWNYHSLSVFVDKLMHPFQRIHSLKELFNLKMKNDFVILGLFEKLDNRFQIFTKTALRSLELNKDITFAVYVGSKSNNNMGETSTNTTWPMLKLYNKYSSNEFKRIIWTTDLLMKWITNETKSHSFWLNIEKEKSLLFSKYLNSGPSLLLFTHKTAFGNNVDYLTFKQVFYAYTNCKNSSAINQILRNISVIQKGILKQMSFLNKNCKSYDPINNPVNTESTYSQSDECMDDRHRTVNKHNANISIAFTPQSNKDCLQLRPASDIFIDTRSTDNIKESQFRQNCRRYLESVEFLKYNPIYEFDPAHFFKANSSHCIRNSSFAFNIIDNIEHKDYLKKILSLDIDPNKKSQVILIDGKNERTYQMNEPITFFNCMQFIFKYYNGQLGSDNVVIRSSIKKENPNINRNFIGVASLNSKNYENITSGGKETIIVMFHSPQCALCNVMARNLLQLLTTLKNIVDIKLYRIDAENNDLNWQYTMEIYPTLLVIPKNKTSETRVFPNSMKVNYKNLFGFILSSLDTNDQLLALASQCQNININIFYMNCLRSLRGRLSTEINYQLQKYEFSDERIIQLTIFDKIVKLRNLYENILKVEMSCDLELVLKSIKLL